MIKPSLFLFAPNIAPMPLKRKQTTCREEETCRRRADTPLIVMGSGDRIETNFPTGHRALRPPHLFGVAARYRATAQCGLSTAPRPTGYIGTRLNQFEWNQLINRINRHWSREQIHPCRPISTTPGSDLSTTINSYRQLLTVLKRHVDNAKPIPRQPFFTPGPKRKMPQRKRPRKSKKTIADTVQEKRLEKCEEMQTKFRHKIRPGNRRFPPLFCQKNALLLPHKPVEKVDYRH